MGSDIHAYVERRKADGAWEFVPWPGSEEDGPFEAPRDYNVFGLLGDVRNFVGIPPVAPRRGLPPDASAEVTEAYEAWDLDGHAHSWVTVDELLAVDYETGFEIRDEDTGEPTGETGTFRQHLGREYFDDLAVLERLNAVSPTRVVFWFDS